MKTLVTGIVFLLSIQSFAAAQTLNQAQWSWLQTEAIKSKNKNTKTVAIDKVLTNKKLSQEEKDRGNLLLGRIHYQNEKFNLALQSYSKIPQSSDYWFEALEEKAWSNVRLNKYGEAMAELKTILAPVFAPLIGPEPYFLAALINLKTCNYTQLFEQVQDFKKRYQERANEIQKLASTGATARTEVLLNKILAANKLDWEVLGSDVQWLPRMYWIDAEFKKQFEKYKTSKTGNLTPFLKRLKELAQRDAKEIKLNLTKIQLAEAEGIQRVHMKEHYKDNVIASQVNVSKDELAFPNSDEVWLDEVDHYKVNTDGCNGVKEKSL